MSYGTEASAPAPAPASAPTLITLDFDAGIPSDYSLITFGGTVSTLDTTPPDGGSGTAAEVIKTDGAQTWAGVTFLSLASGEIIAPESDTASMRVWAPEAGTVVRLKLEDVLSPTHSVETEATTLTSGWQTLNFDFKEEAAGTAAVNHSFEFNKASVFFDFGNAGTGATYYLDNFKYSVI